MSIPRALAVRGIAFFITFVKNKANEQSSK